MVAERGAASPAATLQCGECGAEINLGEYRTAVCPYCASPTVVERPPAPGRPNPVFVVPFTVTEERAHELVRDWSRRRRWLHRSLQGARIEDMKGVYMPACLYSAITSATYRAEIGENYTVTETYTATENGKTVTRTRTRTETEWRGLSGDHGAYATDLVVTASRGLPNDELDRIEPFDLRALRRYSPALVSGWLVEEPSLGVAECTELARGEAVRLEEARLARFMPGDRHRDLRFDVQLRDETVDPILVPVWVLAVRPRADQPAVRVVCNGQSGEAWGPERVSPAKIVLWIAVLLLVILIGVLIATAGRP
jgi:DNA-directed RNA polymerase subunit RPC12/RpoP